MCNLPLPATLHRAVKLLWLLVKLNRNRKQKKSFKALKKSCKGAPKYPLNSLIFIFDRLYCTVHMYNGHCTPVLYSVASAGSSRQHQREEREEDLTDKMLLSEAENPCEAQLTYLFEVKKK